MHKKWLVACISTPQSLSQWLWEHAQQKQAWEHVQQKQAYWWNKSSQVEIDDRDRSSTQRKQGMNKEEGNKKGKGKGLDWPQDVGNTKDKYDLKLSLVEV